MKVKTDTWMTLSFLGPLQDGAQGGQFSESPETFSFIKDPEIICIPRGNTELLPY